MKKLYKEKNNGFKIHESQYTCLHCCLKSTCNAWLMGSHESIYELLGTYMKEGKRYSLALTAQLACWGGKCLDYLSFLGKTSRALSGKVEVTGL